MEIKAKRHWLPEELQAWGLPQLGRLRRRPETPVILDVQEEKRKSPGK